MKPSVGATASSRHLELREANLDLPGEEAGLAVREVLQPSRGRVQEQEQGEVADPAMCDYFTIGAGTYGGWP